MNVSLRRKPGLYDNILHGISSSSTDTSTFDPVINLPHSLNLLKNSVCKLKNRIFLQCEAERDELHSRFVSSILELQQKTGLKNVLLEKKLEKLSDLLEQREAQIGEVLAAAQLDPMAIVNVNQKLEEMLNRKNTAIQDLQYDLAKVCKAHDDLLATYESKLQEYGIPESKLGLQPLRAKMIGTKIGRGPAGLITVNR